MLQLAPPPVSHLRKGPSSPLAPGQVGEVSPVVSGFLTLTLRGALIKAVSPTEKKSAAACKWGLGRNLDIPGRALSRPKFSASRSSCLESTGPRKERSQFFHLPISICS